TPHLRAGSRWTGRISATSSVVAIKPSAVGVAPFAAGIFPSTVTKKPTAVRSGGSSRGKKPTTLSPTATGEGKFPSAKGAGVSVGGKLHLTRVSPHVVEISVRHDTIETHPPARDVARHKNRAAFLPPYPVI